MDMLREMALFVEVAKAMSFKRASEASGTPASSLSRRVANLEKAVGVRLFNRTTRSIELTEAGAIYYARCRDIVEAARIAHEQLADVAETPRGRFRVSTTVEFARLFLGPLIADYVRLYPALKVEFDLQPHKVDLIAQNFDLALRIGPQPDSSLISRRLGMIRTTLFAAPSFLDRAGRPSTPEDLGGRAAILNLNSPRPDVWVLSRDGAAVEVRVDGPVSVNNFGTMRQLAVAGIGITGLHEPMVGEDVRTGRLERVLPDWILREAPVYAIMPSRLLPAKTRLFLDMLTKRVAPQLELSRSSMG
jgi:DNA-binding transcriptional LysR family regulator